MTGGRIALPRSRSCFVCGVNNVAGLKAQSILVDGRVELEFLPAEHHGGWNDVTHGGLVATVLDEVMTWSAIVRSEKPCYAAEFSVRLRRPLITGTPCLAVAFGADMRRRILDTRADLVGVDGEIYASATGRYMAIPTDQAGAMKNDMLDEEGCWPAHRIFDS